MSDSAAADRESSACQHRISRRPWLAYLVVFTYFLSGIVALSYEVLWARLLSLQFGVSIFGVVITVSAFMAGLGVGSLYGAKSVVMERVNPFYALAAVEIFVAFFAIVMPDFFSSINKLTTNPALESGFYLWYALQAAVALAVLFLPAAALGFGFPLILRILRNEPISIGAVYGLNALGGVVGALLPLLLLPLFGLITSLYTVAFLGICIGVAFILISRLAKSNLDMKPTDKAGNIKSAAMLPRNALLAYSLVGCASLVMQIAWTRIYGMLLLRTEYVLAVILAVFLLGMALGSVLLRGRKTDIWLTILPIAGAFGAVVSLWTLPLLAEISAKAEYPSLFSALFYQAGYVALCTLPVTLILGAWLPILSNLFKSHGNIVAARFYGVNAIGCALGSLFAGFVLFPLVGSAGAICISAAILLIVGLYFSPLRRRAWISILPLLILAWPVSKLPPASVLLPATLSGAKDIYYYEDAISITHVVEQADGQRLLLDDLQRMDASSEPTAVMSQQNQARLPLLLHPHPQSVLFLGVGTGISASGALAYENMVRVGVELSQGAIEASQHYFAEVNNALIEKGQLRVVRDDARRYLKTTSESFDVIVGDLFHPDFVGRGALLSLEQFERAKAKLNDNGVFVQWLAMNQFDRRSLDIVLRTFDRVFEHNQLYLDGFRLALVGSKGGEPTASAMLSNLSRLTSESQALATGGEGGWTWLGRYFGKINSSSGEVQGELATIVEYQLPKARYSGDLDLVKVLNVLLSSRPSVNDAKAQLHIAAEQSEYFERAYMAVELGLRSWVASVQGKYDEAERLVRFAYSANPKDRWVSFDLADRMYATLDQVVASGYEKQAALLKILEIRPDHEKALRDMVSLSRDKGDRENMDFYSAKLKRLSPLSKER